MLNIFQTVNDTTIKIDTLEKGAWVNLVNPTEEEIQLIAQQAGIYTDFLKYPLDDEEIPRIEIEDEQLMIIINVPIKRKEDVIYDTIPLGIVINDDYVITICLEDINLEQDFASNKLKGMATFKKTRFVFQLFQKQTSLYLKYLREINRQNEQIERELHKSMRNKELINLLNMEKSLVYFTTSLRANEKVMQRLLRGKTLKMYEEDSDLLEDILIENRQAIEMADIYSNISSGTMDAFASIISNNLNIVMKFLAGITIVLSIPTMIFSFFGMNVPLPLERSVWGYFAIIVLCIIACLFIARWLKKKDML